MLSIEKRTLPSTVWQGCRETFIRVQEGYKEFGTA